MKPATHTIHYPTKQQASCLLVRMMLCIGVCLFPGVVRAQQPSSLSTVAMVGTSIAGNDNEGTPDYDEVPITLTVPRIGSMEIDAVVFGEELYLPVTTLFDFLKIQNSISPDFNSVTGFVLRPENTFSIDKITKRIVYGERTFPLMAADMIRTDNNLYLKSYLFGKVFGLDCHFDFRNLSVVLNSRIELPAIREMQQEMMRRNIHGLQGEKKADTSIGRSFSMLHIGMADWTVATSQEEKGISNTRLNLALGGMVAGGELDLSLNYFSKKPMTLRQQNYQWRYVNNERKVVRQVTAGKLYLPTTATLYSPVIGVQVTNTASGYRKSFGTYTISNTTKPGWIVELYVNEILVNYVKADASGFYTLEVPMVYGNTRVRLRFYGPFGEEETSEKDISVPFNFVPQGQLEYSVAAGVVDDQRNARFSRAVVNYGLSKKLTVGAGSEFLSSLSSGKAMPFVQASLVLGSSWLVSADHSYGVRSRVTVNYRRPSNLQVDAIYTKYAPGQTAILVNYTEEKKLVLSVPMRGKKFNSFSRLTLNQFTFPFNQVSGIKTRSAYTSAEYLVSAAFAGITTNMTTFAALNKESTPLVYTNLAAAFRLPKGFRFSPQAQYEYRRKMISMLKGELEKNISTRGFMNVSYQKDPFNVGTGMVTLGLRFNFSFAETFLTTSRRGKTNIATASARGSILFDSRSGYLSAGNRSQVGRGGITLIPFVDLNRNGKKDAGEPKAAGLKLHVNGGRIEDNIGDTLIRVTGLEAYSNYFLELETNGFENVSWQISHHSMNVMIDPNRLKLIEVPVTVGGEVSGVVILEKKEGSTGLGRLYVNIYDGRSQLVAKVLTESDGFFSYIGLAPGSYTASLDKVQLDKLNLIATGPFPFSIKQKIEGDIAEGVNFTVKLIAKP